MRMRGALLVAVAAACGSEHGAPGSSGNDASLPPPFGGSDSSVQQFGDSSFPAGDGSANDTDAAVFTGPLAGPFGDFPSTPVIDSADGGAAATPANSPSLFGGPTQGAASGGPCLIEPEVNALYPNNWLRPRFTWVAASGENLFELRLHVANQANDLVVYTAQSSWTMPKSMWDGLRAHSQDVPITVSVRGAQLTNGALQSEALGSSGALGIAPAPAPGVIVYWAIVGSGARYGTLKGFAIGDETVVSVLAPAQVQERAPATAPCIGCHTSTPDGLNVAFSIGPNPSWPYTNSVGTIGAMQTPGLVPSFLTPDAKTALDSLKGVATFSLGHWAQGDRIVLLSDTGDLHWVNLEGTGAQASGVVARTAADNGAATAPTWSHDGTTIVYTSLPQGGITDGRANTGPMDLYTMPYGNRSGGGQSAIPGASDPGVEEHYPSFSPDDRYLVFNGIPQGQTSYNNPRDELFVIPAAGGTKLRLAANDPPACSGEHSPGVTNSWAKWAPLAQPVPVLGLTYYWVVFSSTRYPGGTPQLFITAVVANGQGKLTTYGSLYLWNQPAQEHNHTPAWDVFQIPPRPPPPPQ